ncbi:MAG: molybdenum cofactor guanylyltransferase MobA [Alphaproteobacteria bacterium]|nr:MAG: molybdenum cofactor guanylyltransferase MobA [Alphaproteobacteria bacterium]
MPDIPAGRATALAGVLLAGGRSRRMGGGDKCLRPLAGRPMLAHIIARARPQVGPLVLNVNGDSARFADFGIPVAGDVVAGFAGPLAGILTGLEWAAQHAPQCTHVASFACDAPFFPEDLVARLAAAMAEADAELACAASAGRAHPVFALWPVALRASLRQALVGEGLRKIDAWTARYRLVTVDFPAIATVAGPLDPFFNVNTPADLAAAEDFAAALAVQGAAQGAAMPS